MLEDKLQLLAALEEELANSTGEFEPGKDGEAYVADGEGIDGKPLSEAA
ncbi:hypothetical protein [Sphingobium sp. EM0848]|nr:hypothetical protein [Sphingobium sp. EM0848]